MNNKIILKLQEFAEKGKDKYALIELDNTKDTFKITYGDFYQKVKELGEILIEKGYSNNVVILFMNNDINSIISLYACFYANVIPIIKSYNKDKLELDKYKQEIETLFNLFKEIQYVFVDDYFESKISPLNLLEDKIVNINGDKIKDGSKCLITTNKNYDFILFTSGTTAVPKCVKISINKMLNNILFKTNLWKVDKSSKFLNWLPISHIYGLASMVFVPLYFGATSYLMKPHQYYHNCLLWLECITKFSITHSSIINFAFNQLTALNLNNKKIDLTSLQNLSIGGEPVKVTSLEKFYKKYKEYGFQYSCFSPSYGMSENSGLVSEYKSSDSVPLYILVDKKDLIRNKISIVNIGTELINLGKVNSENIKIQNVEDGKFVGENEIGEVLISNRSLYIGYLGAEDFNSEYFHTGDLGFIHNECLYLSGRIKDIIIIRGKNFSSYMIENSISNELKDYDLGYNALLTLPNSDELIFVQEVLNDVSQMFEKNIKRMIQEIIFKYTKYLIPYEKIYLKNSNEIPKLSSGKLDKITLVRKILEEEIK